LISFIVELPVFGWGLNTVLIVSMVAAGYKRVDRS